MVMVCHDMFLCHLVWAALYAVLIFIDIEVSSVSQGKVGAFNMWVGKIKISVCVISMPEIFVNGQF